MFISAGDGSYKAIFLIHAKDRSKFSEGKNLVQLKLKTKGNLPYEVWIKKTGSDPAPAKLSKELFLGPILEFAKERKAAQDKLDQGRKGPKVQREALMLFDGEVCQVNAAQDPEVREASASSGSTSAGSPLT